MLLERDAELNNLNQLIEHLAAGHGALALVSGEAGIGKSALLDAMAGTVPQSVELRRGRCDNLVTPIPFCALREAFDDAAPTIHEAFDGGALLDVLSALTHHLDGRAPTALLVEDVQWADAATLDALVYLAHRLDHLPLLLVVTYRDEEVLGDHALQRLLTAPTAAQTVRMHLSPLSPGAVQALARGSPRDPRRLYELTGGNPFFVTEVMATTDSLVPETLSAAVATRVHRLSETARRATERISVWPGVMEFEMAEELLGPDFAALTEAEERGILAVEESGIRFRYEIARLATEATLTVLRRRQAQRDVTELLKRRGEKDLPRLVHHAVRWGDAATILEFAPRAAHLSARAGAHRQALEFFRAALQHEELLSDPELAVLLDAYAWELYTAYRLSDAVEHSARAVNLFRGLQDERGEAEALIRRSPQLFTAGDLVEARASASRAVDLSDDRHPATAAAALGTLGGLLALEGSSEEAVRVLGRGGELARESDRRDVAALCETYLAICDPHLTPDDRVEVLRRGLAGAREAGAPEFVARGFTNLADFLYRYGRYRDLEQHLGEGLRFVREHGFTPHAYSLQVHQALLHQRQGRWDSALAALNSLVDGFPDPGMLLLCSLPSRARLLARLGDLEVKEVLVRCWDGALSVGTLATLGLAGPALVEWAWLAGQPREAERVLQTWADHASRPTAGPIDAEIRRYARLAGLDVPHGQPLSADSAGAWHWDGDWRAAAEAWHRAGDPYEEALELASSGEVEPTLHAFDLLTELGAVPAARHVKNRLRAMGVRTVPRGPTRRTRGNPAGLTDRQLEVVRLLEEGLTNSEIAERLVVSVRTVDHHVSSALDKLGVSSRREAALLSRSWQRINRDRR